MEWWVAFLAFFSCGGAEHLAVKKEEIPTTGLCHDIEKRKGKRLLKMPIEFDSIHKAKWDPLLVCFQK